jgi:hypothetical protein
MRLYTLEIEIEMNTKNIISIKNLYVLLPNWTEKKWMKWKIMKINRGLKWGASNHIESVMKDVFVCYWLERFFFVCDSAQALQIKATDM